MSRSGYTDDCDDILASGRFHGRVMSAIRGGRGQKFLRELAAAMDAMPVKELIAGELVTAEGDCCTMGVVCKARGIDVEKLEYEGDNCEEVAANLNIAQPMAQEIAYENDEGGPGDETDAARWVRMRKWVDIQIAEAARVKRA